MDSEHDRTRYSALETQVFRKLSSPLGSLSNSAENDQVPSEELGLGSGVMQRPTTRLLRSDGTFNVQRVGYSILGSRSVYHHLLTMSWGSFLGVFTLFYLSVNLIFGIGFFICGRDALGGLESSGETARMFESIAFSIQTFGTIGYGKIYPSSVAAHILVSLEAFLGMLGYAVIGGLVFARFSRPSARIRFSQDAIIAPFRNGRAFQFRIINERESQIIDLRARVVMSRLELDGTGIRRKFYNLKLERDEVMFFPLNWTIVHPIDEKSPLHGMTQEQLIATDAEILVLLEGVDETFSQTVHSRTSYKGSEIKWGKKFVPILEEMPDGSVRIEIDRVSELEDAPLPA